MVLRNSNEPIYGKKIFPEENKITIKKNHKTKKNHRLLDCTSDLIQA